MRCPFQPHLAGHAVVRLLPLGLLGGGLLLGGCGGTSEAPADTGAAAPPPSAAFEATVVADAGTWTFGLPMCDTDGSASLLVSGTTDDGMVLVVDVTDGAGDVLVSDAATLEDVLVASTADLTVDDRGDGTVAFSATGDGFTLDGVCDPTG
jgi:hypothetical protein